MKFYLAPMEGITGYIYRQAYNSCFKPMDRYFTPFLAPKHKSGFSSKELNDILPEHNQEWRSFPRSLHQIRRIFRYSGKIKGIWLYRG